MKARYGRLTGWHLIFCIFYYQLQPLLKERSLERLTEMLYPPELLLTLCGFIIMLVYALLPYVVLRKTYDKPWYVIALYLFFGSLVAVGFRYLMEEVVAFHLIGYRNYPSSTTLLTYYLDNLYYVFLHGSIGVIFYLLEMTRFRERQRQELLVEQQRTELAYLRAQINPHFLFNTLNNVYSLFYQQSDKALKAIERLTVMLRYGLYEKAEKVPLEQELEHLLNFIELEKLRYDYEPEIELDFPSAMPPVNVPPLILITFVENAFKHGDLRKTLSIALSVGEEQGLDFKVANTMKQQQKDATGGIGLVNLRKRLQLIYGSEQSVEVTVRENQFIAQLKIQRL